MSKDLEALEDIILYLNASEPKGLYCKNIETIQQALLKAEKEHKALEIIKEKEVDVFRFKKLDFDTFNQLQKSCKLPELTKEEFNLLKGILNDEQ